MKKVFLKSIKYSLIFSLCVNIVMFFTCMVNHSNSVNSSFLGINYSFEMGHIDNILELIVEVILSIIVYALPLIILILFLELPYYIFKTASKADNIVARSYEDSKDAIYNRDLPSYGPAVAGYIIDYTTDSKQDYIATYVDLIRKGYIGRDYQGNEIINNVKQDQGELSECEKYVLNTYEKYLEVCLTGFSTFNSLVREDAKKLNLINNSNFIVNDFSEKIDNILSKRTTNVEEVKTLVAQYSFIVLVIIAVICMFQPLNLVLVILAIIIVRKVLSKGKYTKEGIIEKEKMAKLREFMISQTNLKDKDINDRNFEDFIPYAIAFDINNKYQEKEEEILRKVVINN